MTAYSTDENAVISASAKAAESLDALAKRLTDGFDPIWDEINGAKVISVHGDRFCISEALVLAAFLPDEERRCVLDDVRGELQNYLHNAATAEYYDKRKEADEVAADWAYDAAREDRLFGRN